MYNKQLETFIHVADAGSFAKAAEIMYVSPPALIKQINLLEASLDLQLFVRSHRGLTLTEAGASLYSDAKYIIEYSKDSLVRAKNVTLKDESIIRIGASLMTPTQFLIELWPRIHEHCPNMKFHLIPFENNPQNAREILMNLGQNIDLVAGIYDPLILEQRKCAALELSREPICCAVSIHHRLASKEVLSIDDMFGENLMLINRGWNGVVDALRDDITAHYPQINIIDFPFYDISVFNQCESEGNLLMSNINTHSVHPLLKIIPVDWPHAIPFGILHSPKPSPTVRAFIQAVAKVYGIDTQ